MKRNFLIKCRQRFSANQEATVPEYRTNNTTKWAFSKTTQSLKQKAKALNRYEKRYKQQDFPESLLCFHSKRRELLTPKSRECHAAEPAVKKQPKSLQSLIALMLGMTKLTFRLNFTATYKTAITDKQVLPKHCISWLKQ